MKADPCQQVALLRNLDDKGVKEGRRVRASPRRRGRGPLEIHNALGESLCVVAVKESDIEPLNADEVLAVRPLGHSG